MPKQATELKESFPELRKSFWPGMNRLTFKMDHLRSGMGL